MQISTKTLGLANSVAVGTKDLLRTVAISSQSWGVCGFPEETSLEVAVIIFITVLFCLETEKRGGKP